MYFSDESDYVYDSFFEENGFIVKNIGWLSVKHHFPVGEFPSSLKEKLLELCLNPVNLTKGFHRCDICIPDSSSDDNSIEDNSVSEFLEDIDRGNGEIWIFYKDVYYAAPTLIYHYVVKHSYIPPVSFLKALEFGHRVDPELIQREIYHAKNESFVKLMWKKVFGK